MIEILLVGIFLVLAILAKTIIDIYVVLNRMLNEIRIGNRRRW